MAEYKTIAEAVRGFFKANDWKYAEEDGIFESGTPLDAPINSALIHIITDQTALAILTALDYNVPEESTFTVLESGMLCCTPYCIRSRVRGEKSSLSAAVMLFSALRT